MKKKYIVKIIYIKKKRDIKKQAETKALQKLIFFAVEQAGIVVMSDIFITSKDKNGKYKYKDNFEETIDTIFAKMISATKYYDDWPEDNYNLVYRIKSNKNRLKKELGFRYNKQLINYYCNVVRKIPLDDEFFYSKNKRYPKVYKRD